MTTFQDKLTQFETDADLAHLVVHGDAATVVQTEGGPVRSLAKLVQDNDAAINSSGLLAQANAAAATATQQAAIGAAANQIYATTAAGIGGTSTGQYFYVPAASAQGAYDVWQNVSGVATATGITFPSLGAVQSNTLSITDLLNRGATLRYIPLSASFDTVWGICVDGAYQFYVDSLGQPHAGHLFDPLPSIPQALSNISGLLNVSLKVLPLAQYQDYLQGVLVDGAYVAWYDSLGVFHSNHTHTDFATLYGLAPKNLPLAANQDYVFGVLVDGTYQTWVDSAGVFHSTHTHPEIATLQGQVSTLQTQVGAIQGQLSSGALGGNSTGYLVEQVSKVNASTSATEQQLMVIDGASAYRQMTQTGYNWRAPIVHHNTAVRCISDYFFSGGSDAVTLLATGEIVPEPGVVAHYPVYGQSLALGARGFVTWTGDATNGFTAATVFSSTPSVHGNLCLAFGDGTTGYPRTGTVFNNFGVLQEQWSTVQGETVCSGLANSRNDKLLSKWGMRQRILATSTGLGGTPYTGLMKGTAPYASLIASVSGGKSTANAKGWKYFVPMLYIVHGESETGNILPSTYAGYLLQWLTDFTTDVMPITGQNQPPAMMLSQMNRQKSTNEGVTLGQLLAHDSNAKIILIGPKYQHTYYDDAHMLAEGYVKQGEYGERTSRHWMAGRKWSPLRPVSAIKNANVVAIQFNNTPTSADTVAGPVGQLALDTTVVTNPGNYGFECTDTTVTVTGVALGTDGTSVIVTLSGTPAAGSSIQYAMQSALNLSTMPTGQNTGSRGCLRDTDIRDVSRFDGTYLYNWCVAFRQTIS